MSAYPQQLDMFASAPMSLFENAVRTQEPTMPGGVKLRPYQEEAIEACFNLERQGENRFLAQLATGLGKTVIFSDYARRLARPALILAHRDELIQQAAAKLRAVWPGVDVGIVKAERNESGHQVTIASVQTLSRDRRFGMAFPDHASISRLGLIVTDEAHHAFASTYKSIYSRFGLMEKGKTSCLHMGVTATPKRGDGKAIDDVYDQVAYSMGIREGILQGYLSDLTGYTLTFSNEDMADVKIVGGEYSQDQLEKAVKKVARNEAIVDCWKERSKLEDGSGYRQTIAFCVTVSHAEMLAQAFSEAGIKADLVHGELPDDKRAAVLHRFSSGKTQVICNVGVLTEGFDEPKVSCIIMARPTRSQALYIQCIGRGTRLYPGKQNCLILDVADVSGKMSVIAPVTLSGAIGLPAAKDGKPTKEVGSVIKQLKMKMRAEGLGPGIEEADAEGGKEFNPFADPFAGQDGVNFRWATGKSGLTIPLPQKNPNSKHYLVIQRRDDWLFDVVHVKQEKIENGGGYRNWKTTGEKFVNDHGLPDEAWAASEAEKYAKRIVQGIDHLKNRDAAWRNGPASESQISLLLSKGLMPSDGRQITKGEASAIMDNYFASRVKVGLKRETSQLEFV
jgi:superfamily II DNA or RNA helicase